MLPIFLVFLAVVFVGNIYWCWRLNHWDDLGEERLKKIFVISCIWSQRGKRDHSILPSIELGMSLWGIVSQEQQERCGSAFRLLAAQEDTALGLAQGSYWNCSLGHIDKGEKRS